MSLSKKRIQDQIEIVGEFKIIQIRYSDQIIEDGKVISTSYHREALVPNDDISGQPTDIVEISKLYWTDELKQKYADSLENN